MCTILLAEDHKSMANALVKGLDSKGNFKVAEVAETEEEALEHLRNQQIDLVAHIQEKYSHLPCLMMSSWNSEQYVKRSLVAGARGYVLKDDVYGVIAGIRHVLDGGTYPSKRIIDGE